MGAGIPRLEGKYPSGHLMSLRRASSGERPYGDSRREHSIVGRVPYTGAMPEMTPEILMPLCSVFRRFLRSRGLKYTKERADVLQAIIDHDGPFEAEELLLEMRNQDHRVSNHRVSSHRVSKATIYRTLRLLQEAGIITQALFDSKQSHFQLIYGKQPQDVMVCLRSGRTIDFQNPDLAALRDRICAELGWKSVGHRFQIFAMSPEEDLESAEPSEVE